jgi:hypothetical protein
LETRPIFQKLDETFRGHAFCSFLALVLKKALKESIAALGRTGSWPDIITDLDSLTETEIGHDGKRFTVRHAPPPASLSVLLASHCRLSCVRPQPDPKTEMQCQAAPAALIGIADQ